MENLRTSDNSKSQNINTENVSLIDNSSSNIDSKNEFTVFESVNNKMYQSTFNEADYQGAVYYFY